MPRKQSLPGKGEAPQDDVEKALLRRALGFRQEEIHTEDLCDKKTGDGYVDKAKQQRWSKAFKGWFS